MVPRQLVRMPLRPHGGLASDRANPKPGKTSETAGVCGDQLAVSGQRRGRDDEVVGAPRHTALPNCNEEIGMRLGDGEVIGDDGQRLENVGEEGLTPSPSPPGRQPHPNCELGDGDGGHCGGVVVHNRRIEARVTTFGGYENGGVEEKKSQKRSSARVSSRSSWRSRRHSSSGAWRLSSALASAPRPLVTGPI